MTVSNILEVPLLHEAMAQKTLAVNMALQAMEKAIAGALEIETTAVDGVGIDLPIPFDDTNDLSGRQALRAIFYRLVTGAEYNFDLMHPDNPHLFIIRNDTEVVATLKTLVGGTSVAVPSGATYMVYCDGANMVKMDFTVISIKQVVDFNFAFYGKPTAGQVLGRILVARDTTFNADLSGIRGVFGVNPLTAHTLELWDDGISFATIEIDTFGNLSCTTNDNSTWTVGAGSVVELRDTSPADLLLEQIEICVQAYVTVAQPF